ncbi:flippase [Pedobacter sp. WC2501]|uniref:flippase n=1 Tax=Pedobacter sp. WC2501 TaxID=3461400 RepID=UPI0040467E7A
MAVLRKNAGYNVLLSLTQFAFPLITFPYASRILGPKALGAVSLADNFTVYFLIFSGLGIPLYGLREVAKVKHNRQLLGQTFSSLLFIHLVTAIVAIILFFLLTISIDKLYSNLMLYQIGMAIVLGNVFIAEWFFQGLEEFKYITIRTVIIRSCTVLLLFIFVKGPEDSSIYYGLNLIAMLASAAFNMYYIRKKIHISFKNLTIRKHLMPLFLLLASALVTTIYLVFDTVILSFLTNDTTVGYYAASMRVAKISLSVLGAVSLVLLPRLTFLFNQEANAAAASLLNKSLRFVCFLSVPIAIGIFCLANEIISVFAGQAYLPGVNSLRVLSFLVVVIGLAQVFSNQILLPLMQEKKILYASIVGVIISLSLNFLLIPELLQLGAAVSSLFAEFSVTLVLYVYVRKHFSVVLPVRVFMKSVLASLTFFLIRYLILQITIIPILVLTFTVGLSAIVYLLVQLFIWRNKDVIEVLSGYPGLRFLIK